MRSHVQAFWAGVLSLVLPLVAAEAYAQDPLCIPNAGGVPYNPSPPSWWAPGDDDATPHDAAWRGALALGEQRTLGETGSGMLRVLQRSEAGTKYLYLSFGATDPLGQPLGTPSASDRWLIALASDDGAYRYLFTIMVDTSAQVTTAPDLSDLNVTMQYFTGNPVTPYQPVSPLPSWAGAVAAADVASGGGGSPGRIRAWVECPNGGNCADGANWTIHLRVPIGAADASNLEAALPIGDDFRLWYRADVRVPVTATTIELPWPASAPTLPSDVASWEHLRASTTAPCRTGVSLRASDISTDHPTDPLLITANPTFHARPLNATANGLGGDALEATFRIADWGSVPAAGASWRPLCSGSGNPSLIVDGTSAPGGPEQFDLSCTTTVDICDYQRCTLPVRSDCPPVPAGCPADAIDTAPYRPHQCILTELGIGAGASGTPIAFTPVSAYRNMNVATASTVTREAVISVEGLGPLAGEAGRKVLLYVETRNMPLYGRDRQGEVPSGEWDPKLSRGLAAGRVGFDELSEQVPTYVVHAFHEDRVPAEGGGEETVYRPQPSFGFFLKHAGAFDGWLHGIAGDSVTKLSDYLYLVDVPNDSSTVVTVTVKTCAGDECRCADCGCPAGGDCACDALTCRCQGPDCQGDGGRCAHAPFVCWLLRFWWVFLLVLVVLVGGYFVSRRS